MLTFKLLLSVVKLHKIHSYKISVSFGGMLDMVELLLQTKSWCAFEAFVFLQLRETIIVRVSKLLLSVV